MKVFDTWSLEDNSINWSSSPPTHGATMSKDDPIPQLVTAPVAAPLQPPEPYKPQRARARTSQTEESMDATLSKRPLGSSSSQACFRESFVCQNAQEAIIMYKIE